MLFARLFTLNDTNMILRDLHKLVLMDVVMPNPALADAAQSRMCACFDSS